MTQDPITLLQASKIFTYSGLSFLIAMWMAPFLIAVLNHLKFWKKTNRQHSTTGEELTVTKKFYEENERDKKVPRAGGLLITFTTIFIATVFWIVLKLNYDNNLIQFLNFVDRKETFIPLGALILAALLGLADDILVVMPGGGNYFAGGLKLSHRLIGVTFCSLP